MEPCDETPSRRRCSRRSRDRRAGRACGRVARAGASCRVGGTSRGIVGICRATGRARASGLACTARGYRDRGAGDLASAHPDERTPSPEVGRPRLLVIGAAAAAAVLAVGVGVALFDSGSSATRFQAALGPTGPDARCKRRGDADQDLVWLADRAPCHRASPARSRTLLRSVAAKRRRRARPDWDVQRRQKRHALGGRVAGTVQNLDRHARAGRRRPGFVGEKVLVGTVRTGG